MIGLFLVFREFARAIRYAMRAPEAHALLLTTTVVIAGGSFFYMLVEGWSVLDALYFSVVTLATIGYGDLTPTTDIAKLFTIFYVLIGIGLVASTVATLATAAVRADADRRAGTRANRQQRRRERDASDERELVEPLVGRFAARHTRAGGPEAGTADSSRTKEEDRR